MAPNTKHNRACKAMKQLGYSDKVVKPILKELLKLYDKQWMLIEDDNYRVLLDAILESEEQKAQNNKLDHLDAWCQDEAEESEPPLKRSKRSNLKRQSSTSCNTSISNNSNQPYDQPYGKKNVAESTSGKRQDTDFEVNVLCAAKYHHGKGKCSCSPISLKVVEQSKETDFVSQDESDEARSYLENSKGESDVNIDFSEKHFFEETGKLHDRDPELAETESGSYTHEAAFESEPLPLAYDLPSLPVSPGTTRCLLPEDAYSVGSSSDLEGKNVALMNCRQSEAEKDKIVSQDPLKLDVASLTRGDVKISLMIESSLGADFCVPSLEAVLKQVEEQCVNSYQIIGTGFSLSTLMKEVCKCFLAAGTTSSYAEDVRPTDVLPLGMSDNPSSENGPAESIDHHLHCSIISNNPARIGNLFHVSPQIPRSVGSIQLDLSHCKIYLNGDLSGSSEMKRNIMEINRHAPSSSRMMIVQTRCYHYIRDISKGHEACAISLINEVNEEQGPTFNYIPKNVTYKNAYVMFPLARILQENCCSNCSGDCLSQEIPCTCAGKSGFEFAYTPGCMLTEKLLDYFISTTRSTQQNNLFYCWDCPLERSKGKTLSGKCKGHIKREFIKECWYKCGCSMKCGNRVVQRGITAKLQVFMTPEQKGWGLRTKEDIPKGAFVCEYVGEVVTNRESFERSRQKSGDELTHTILLDAGWSSKSVMKDEEAVCLDATVHGNVARFINHRCCDANMVEVPVEVETPDHHYYHLAFFTTRKINALEELT